MHDKNYYLKLLRRYIKLGNENGIRATREVLVRFEERQISMKEFVK